MYIGKMNGFTVHNMSQYALKREQITNAEIFHGLDLRRTYLDAAVLDHCCRPRSPIALLFSLLHLLNTEFAAF